MRLRQDGKSRTCWNLECFDGGGFPLDGERGICLYEKYCSLVERPQTELVVVSIDLVLTCERVHIFVVLGLENNEQWFRLGVWIFMGVEDVR